MKNYAVGAAFLLALGVAGPASAIEVLNNQYAMASAAMAGRAADLAPLGRAVMLTNGQSAELPEPEVFAMMLLGLVLIGYRARRDSSDTFI